MSAATEAGGFRARNDPPTSFYRVSLEVAYVEGAEPAAMRRALADCHAEAVAELGRRFPPRDDRRHPASGERR